MDDILTPLARRTRFGEVYQSLREQLEEIVPDRTQEITPTQRFDQLIPLAERRRVWQQLQQVGFVLPPLRLPSRVVLASTCIVLAPVALLVLLINWSFAFTAVELYIWARRITRPMAVEVPAGCQTVQEAVLQLTPFRRQDYMAGLWPREAIALRVRMLFARAAGVPLQVRRGPQQLSYVKLPVSC
jgi:hypothetical protein